MEAIIHCWILRQGISINPDFTILWFCRGECAAFGRNSVME